MGDIYFEPKTITKPGDFVFVMSIDGKVRFQPQGDFCGSIAGDVSIELWPGSKVTWVPWSGEDLNFPAGGSETLEILTWESSALQ
ncbi:hypothetical protein ES708_25187 [subsurface metagenome]